MKDKVASPNKILWIVSLREVGLKLTTCQRSFGGNPLIKAFDNSSSRILHQIYRDAGSRELALLINSSLMNMFQ